MKLLKSTTFICTLLFLTFSKSYSQSFLFTQYQDLDGDYVSVNDLKGEKYTVLDFWATWCKPCVKSIPEMVKINNDFVDRGIVIIGVDVDSPRNLSKVRPFANSMGVNYPVILDTDQELMTAFNISVLPTFIILDGKGKRIYSHEGYVPGDEVIIREQIEKLLSDE